ncbi:MAG: glutamate-5-semialdehyde dehydrogenase [Suipraeoptans sp.]
MSYMQLIGNRAKNAAKVVGYLTQEEKARGLTKVARELVRSKAIIIEENAKDLKAAKQQGMSEALVDRMMLNDKRIKNISDSILDISSLSDIIGSFEGQEVRPNGLKIGKKRVPLGVVGMIYESRPNVTADAFALCFKTNNVAILRGSADAIYSNVAIVDAIHRGLKKAKITEDAVLLVEETSHEVADEMMKLNEYIDVLIPRGGAGLIKRVVENSTVPVIETGTGNCHIYVDEFGSKEKALDIIENAKTQRYGVCNACESLVIHKNIAGHVIPSIVERLGMHEVVVKGDKASMFYCTRIQPASEEDWGMEYLDKMISMKVVDDIDEAIEHINKYSTGHSEAIVTEGYQNAERFQERVDAAAVYINASTRFTDGFEFGFGAEIGISTQKLHARGPMGLKALTTTKYVIYGNGQVRAL